MQYGCHTRIWTLYSRVKVWRVTKYTMWQSNRIVCYLHLSEKGCWPLIVSAPLHFAWITHLLWWINWMSILNKFYSIGRQHPLQFMEIANSGWCVLMAGCCHKHKIADRFAFQTNHHSPLIIFIISVHWPIFIIFVIILTIILGTAKLESKLSQQFTCDWDWFYRFINNKNSSISSFFTKGSMSILPVAESKIMAPVLYIRQILPNFVLQIRQYLQLLLSAKHFLSDWKNRADSICRSQPFMVTLVSPNKPL